MFEIGDIGGAAMIRLHEGAWRLGTRVRKIKGSSWQGCVVGYYSTTLTPEGYAVESEREPGSVQIYPRAALDELEAALEEMEDA
jgi:hypothetical protein